MNMTLAQLNSDSKMRGRVMSISMMTFGMMDSGIFLAGFTIFFGLVNKTFRKIQ